MTTILFIDAESSGLLLKGKPLDDPDQPWPVSICADLTDGDGNSLAGFHTQIRADGRKITHGAETAHGITSRQAGRSGVSEVVVLGMLIGMVSQIGPGGRIVVQNKPYIRDLICSSLIKRQKSTDGWLRSGIEWVDIGEIATPFLKLPGDNDGYRRPTLYEEVEHFMGYPAESRNNPVVDISYLRCLYSVLTKRGAV